jgi:hypothetical protein
MTTSSPTTTSPPEQTAALTLASRKSCQDQIQRRLCGSLPSPPHVCRASQAASSAKRPTLVKHRSQGAGGRSTIDEEAAPLGRRSPAGGGRRRPERFKCAVVLGGRLLWRAGAAIRRCRRRGRRRAIRCRARRASLRRRLLSRRGRGRRERWRPGCVARPVGGTKQPALSPTAASPPRSARPHPRTWLRSRPIWSGSTSSHLTPRLASPPLSLHPTRATDVSPVARVPRSLGTMGLRVTVSGFGFVSSGRAWHLVCPTAWVRAR